MRMASLMTSSADAPMNRGKLHALAALATVLAIVSSPCSAAVFKCVAGNGQASYQALPCENEERRVELHVRDPAPGEQAAARTRVRKEQRFVTEIESEREAARRSARSELKRNDEERQAQTVRCAGYQERAERADADARMHLRRNRYKRDHELRARTLRDRYFSECFAAD